MKDWLTLDRLEEDTAVLLLEDRSTLLLPRAVLPSEAEEQDVLYLEGGNLHVDTEETLRRRNETRDLFRRLMGQCD